VFTTEVYIGTNGRIRFGDDNSNTINDPTHQVEIVGNLRTFGNMTANTVTTGNIIGNNTDPNVYVETSIGGTTSTWTFGTNGVFTLPANSAVIQGAGTDSNVNIVSSDGTTTATWHFDKQGNLTLPTNANINYANGRSILSGLSGGGGGTNTGNIRFNGSTVYSSYEPDNIYIDTTGGDYTWTFGTDGTLTAPNNITMSAGTLTLPGNIAVTPDRRTITVRNQGGTNDGTGYVWIEQSDWLTAPADIRFGDRVEVTGSPSSFGTVTGPITGYSSFWVIPTGTVDANSLFDVGSIDIVRSGTWTFGPDGSITLPTGSVFDSNNAYVSGPTLKLNSNSATDPVIITAPDGTYGLANGQSILVQGSRSYNGSGLPGGNVTVAGGWTDGGSGAHITVYGGGGENAPSPSGGNIDITAGYDSGSVDSPTDSLLYSGYYHGGQINFRTSRYNDSSPNVWSMDVYGVLSLPENGSIKPYGAANDTQVLKIVPTGGEVGDHIHLLSGGLATTSIFLGTDQQYVRTRADGAMVIGTGDYEPDTPGQGNRWIFSNIGETTFPDHQPVTITGNLTVGNLVVNGNSTIINTESYTVVDNIIQMATDNPADTLDIGFVGHRTVGSTLEHTGLIRDASTGLWKLFSNVTAQPGTTVDFTDAIFDDLQLDKLYADTIHLTGTAPSTVYGASGDLAGDIHVDSNYLYYCTSDWVTNTYTVGWDGATSNTIFLVKGDYPTPQVGWTITRGEYTFTIDTVADESNWRITYTGTPYGEGAGGTATLTNPNQSAIWKTIPLSAFSTPAYSNANVETYIGANIGAYQTWANATFSIGGGSSYSNTNVAAYLSAGISSNVKTTANVIAPNFLFANGVNILSTVGASSTYSNANVIAMYAANTYVGFGNVGTAYTTQANVTQMFIGNTTTIGAGSNQLGGTYILNNAYFGANGAMYARNTQTGAAQFSVSGGSFSWAGTTGAVTANSVQSFGLWASLSSTGLSTSNSIGITSAGVLTASGGLILNSNATIVTNQSTASIFNTTATTINFVGAATTITTGASTANLVVGTSAGLGNVFARNFNGTHYGNAIGTTATYSGAVTANTLTVGNILTVGSNITVGNLITSGTYGNITGANVISANTFVGTNAVISGNVSALNFTGNGYQLTSVATKVSGSWTLAAGSNTVNITVPGPGTYTLWVNGNIPNGICTYTATVVVTNTNVPVLGGQYAWNYAAGNMLEITSIPGQIVGTAGSIITTAPSTTTAYVFEFGITNNSGASCTVNYGYTKLS
jgi:hypothetical protein